MADNNGVGLSRYIETGLKIPEGIFKSIITAAESAFFPGVQEMRRASIINELTQLPNRESIEDHVRERFGDDSEVFVLFMDVDGLKTVNDNIGHEYGDLYLQAVADRLNQVDGLVFHISGDEFVVILGVDRNLGTQRGKRQEALTDPQGFVDRTSQLVRESVEHTADLTGTRGTFEIDIQVSVGCVYCEDSRIETIRTSMVHADLEMYHDKSQRQAERKRMHDEAEFDRLSGREEFIETYLAQDAEGERIRELTSPLVTSHEKLEAHYDSDVRKNVPPHAYEELMIELEQIGKPNAARYIRGLAQGTPIFLEKDLFVGSTGESLFDARERTQTAAQSLLP